MFCILLLYEVKLFNLQKGNSFFFQFSSFIPSAMDSPTGCVR